MSSGSERPASPRLGRRPATTVSDILDAAERVGLDRLTRAAVARELGVSDATIRHHVQSIERLYTLASARAFGGLRLDAPEERSWQGYLRVLSERFIVLLEQFPGLEDYVLRGPYARPTLEMFEQIMDEIMRRDHRLDRKAAHILGSRLLTLTAALRPREQNRYPNSQYPRTEFHRSQTAWTIEAFILGADELIKAGVLPDAVPTPDATWTHLDAPREFAPTEVKES
ncbi:putative transcriptional regulator, TetR family [Nocardia nova SH22a]|uniref:Putative transcriptional regulator, TetR family n=1 Tax=Nocardia nova SH22a TaxID=1415166 RepID=W5TMC1_9NOCA|nr:putative transcriptional regulator, TetR family [Nocardia nova SH22a]